jgi:hypothetical protein
MVAAVDTALSTSPRSCAMMGLGVAASAQMASQL